VARQQGPTWPSQVEVWSTTDASLIRTLEIEAGYTPHALAYSHDGTRLAVGATGSRALTLWDTATGDLVEELAAPGVMSLSERVAFAAGDDLILAEQPFGVTQVYALTPTRTLRTLSGHAGSVWDVAIHPQGWEALSAGDDATVRRWEWQTGAQVGQLMPQPERVYVVAYSPQGDSVLVAGEDGEARLYDPNGDGLRLTLTGHRGAIFAAVFRPDGRELATAGQDGTVRVWDSSTGAPQWTVEGLTEGLDALAYSPDGSLLAGGAGAGPSTTVYLWDAYTGEEVLRLTGHRSTIAALAFSPDGTLLASGSWDQTIKLWDVTTGDGVATLEGHTELITDLAFSPDGSVLASIAEDYTLRLWEPTRGDLLATVTLPRALPWALAFSPDGHALITAHADGKLRTWLVDPADSSPEADLLRVVGRVPRATAAFTPVERRAYGIDTYVGAYALSASGNANRSDEPTVTSLIVLPATPERIVGLTGEGFLIESTTQGETWHLRARLPLTLTVNSLGIPARADDPLLLATEQGLYRRAANGTLTQINSMAMTAVSYSHTHPDELWAVTRNGVFKSEDGGATWGEADANLFPNRLVGPLLMAAPNNNPQFVMGFPANVPALTHWRGSGNGFWEQLTGLPPLPVYLRDGYGMAWDSQNQTLYLGGAAGELYASENAATPTAADAAATQIAQFGLGVRALPLAVGQGPTLYVTLLTPSGAVLVRGAWDGRAWEWTWLNLPVMAMG
jgi:WD40 repeat protein